MTPRSSLLLLSLACLCILATPLPVLAETKVLTAEATYTMGDGETPSFAEAMALQKAKQIALEQAGTYVESYTKVQNYNLTTEEIQTIAGGVLQVEVLDKSRTLIGEGLRFYIKIKATVTTDKMEELAQRIKGKNVGEEYKKLQEDYARLNKEIEGWKQLIAKTPSGPEREAALDQIREREKAFSAVQMSEATFFASLISGEDLVRRALDEKAEVDHLLQTIREHGHVIEIGKATAHPVADSPKDLLLTLPVTLKISKTLLPILSETARRLGGSTEVIDQSLSSSWIVGSEFSKDAEGVLITLSKEPNIDRYFRDQIYHLAMEIELYFVDGKMGTCSFSENYLSTSIRRLFLAKRDYNGVKPAFGSDNAQFVVALSDDAVFQIQFRLPTKLAEKMKKVVATFGGMRPRPSSSRSSICTVVLSKKE